MIFFFFFFVFFFFYFLLCRRKCKNYLGFYDNLGSVDPRERPHLDAGEGAATDAASYFTPLAHGDQYNKSVPMAWQASTQVYYDYRLRIKYPEARGSFRAVISFWPGDGAGALRLGCGTNHTLLDNFTPMPAQTVELPLPETAGPSSCRVDGVLTLWCENTPAGGGGSGRGCQLSQLWLHPAA